MIFYPKQAGFQSVVKFFLIFASSMFHFDQFSKHGISIINNINFEYNCSPSQTIEVNCEFYFIRCNTFKLETPFKKFWRHLSKSVSKISLRVSSCHNLAKSQASNLL